MITIKTQKLSLRPYQKGDLTSLVAAINNKNVSRYLARIPFPYTAKDGREWIERCQEEDDKEEPSEINFAVDIGDKVVGGIGLKKIEKNHQVELGYWLAEPYWGQGIMTEAVNLITKFAFGKLKLIRIYAYVFEPNKASMKVLKKVGFTLEGIMKKGVKKDGRLFDRYLFAKLGK